MAKTPYIEDARLKHLLKVSAISGESRERNVALLMVIYGTGMMLTEVARLPVSAYLKGDGALLEKSKIAAELAYNGKERPLWWSNAKVVNAIDMYLTFRIESGHGVTTRKAAYRGLDPESPLFLTGDGKPYRLMTRKTSTGAVSYSCDSMSQLFRKLHSQAGIEGASAMLGRRTFAVRLHRLGFDLRRINELLGHETLTATKRLIDADPVRLGAIVAGVI
ncbi:tyrosine-type recombinase/integrase [Paraburkholderia sp. CNPSo 3272]|uniref:tyrosine-type recombinase/integrase n=1 Tax=Paraburkholderia sp. CNPSo 3272 TaxID=2940931 RepID=UPI0020B6B828|nr:tyrosine-type recombinase/integrase [Paraburkholderia sp. CNPSo 3272]MCP3724714.1 tyrosine-type recombinase/integrase [Paraburkholderia sp. CNPSo 3272]